MNKKAFAIFAFLILIFSFQNCSQNSNLKNLSKTEDENKKEYPNVVVPADTEFLIITNDLEKSGIVAENFKLDVQRGVAEIENPQSKEKGESYCLTEDQQEELQSILEQSQVCYPEHKEVEDDDRVCTMEYKYPYATLLAPYFEVKLGETSSGCDKPIDLCEEKSDMLKGFVSYLLKNLKKQACHFVDI